MIKRISIILFVLISIYSCNKEVKQDPFEIGINEVGLLTHETRVRDLDSIFANDSIVKRIGEEQLISASNEIEIYEKGGAKLLVLEAHEESDPSSTIENIQIIDPRYKTASGLSSTSVFKDIKEYYTISKINNTLSTAVIFVDSIQAYFTISKKELPAKFQTSTDAKITDTDIPDSAKIKHFWIHWDNK
ncbi:hypothetical protein [Aquimarina pacifica]|uniref:hypothetical protein n=1 Tax=Aquimarina pacifica TaxID=1296415 RepID=UPI00046F3082|nr:hypothetical protein [Aquimarina pacifica]